MPKKFLKNKKHGSPKQPTSPNHSHCLFNLALCLHRPHVFYSDIFRTFCVRTSCIRTFFMASISCLFFSASSLTSIKERKTFNYLDIETLDRASYWKFQKKICAVIYALSKKHTFLRVMEASQDRLSLPKAPAWDLAGNRTPGTSASVRITCSPYATYS